MEKAEKVVTLSDMLAGIEFPVTGIGSLPHLDPHEGTGDILSKLPQIPNWGQFQRIDFRENMYTQFSEGIPAVVIDLKGERIFFDTSSDYFAGIERFYEAYISGDLDRFRISGDFARGLHVFKDRLAGRKGGKYLVKGQVTGPLSFGLMVTDEKRKSIIYNEDLFDCVVKGLEMKALWQAGEFRGLGEGFILFLDEPYLSSFGSALINVSREKVVSAIESIIRPLKVDGVLTGIHCCGNTDWSLLFETGVDYISFDASAYFPNFVLYAEGLKSFLEGGGRLAYGIIPASSKEDSGDGESLFARLLSQIRELTSRGCAMELLLDKMILTPSCGMGTLTVERSRGILTLLNEVASRMRDAKEKGLL